MIEADSVKRAGLIATQGIRGGANRTVLDRIVQSERIFWAYSDRDWLLDGAAVHVSMVGFDNGEAENERFELDGVSVAHINADLTSLSDTTQAKQLLENLGISFIGTQKGGAFELTESEANKLLSNTDADASDNRLVVRPWINGLDIARRPRGMWIIDFELMPYSDASEFQDVFRLVVERVKEQRTSIVTEAHSAARWWQHQRPRPEMRRALGELNRFIATPRVSKHRLFSWYSTKTLPDSAVAVIARGDDFAFGVLHSRFHDLWSRRLGTQLREAESGFRYTPTTCFETFPFPWPPGKEPAGDARVERIAEAARRLVAMRDDWLNPPGLPEKELARRTLTNLYNPVSYTHLTLPTSDLV